MSGPHDVAETSKQAGREVGGQGGRQAARQSGRVHCFKDVLCDS